MNEPANKTAVVTISSRIPTEPYYHLKEFVSSANRQHINPIWLPNHDWRGLMTKPTRLLKWLETDGSHWDTVISTDSWDVLWLSDLEEVLRKYSMFDRPIVFNAERACFPCPELADKFPHPPHKPSPYVFLNSGFFIGPVECVIEMLRGMNLESIGFDRVEDGKKIEPNDQEAYQRYFLANQDKIDLDYEGALCQSLHESGPDEFTWDPEIKRVRSKLTGRYPCAFHGNGSGKEWLKKIIQWMKL